VAKGHNELVESRVDTGTAYLLNLRFGIERGGDAFVELFLRLGDELYNNSLSVCHLHI
jgi:hypothetical protein